MTKTYVNNNTGTHDIQNTTATVDSTQPSTIEISAGFIPGSKSKGFLAMAHSDNDINFAVATRLGNQSTSSTSITKLKRANYSIYLFTIEENGLPLNWSASIQEISIQDEGIF